MRRRLGEEEGKFCEYTAEFGFYAAKRGQNKVNNALFKNIRDAEGNFITDHVWIPIRLIDVFLKQESDGIYSLNFPYFGGDNDFKAQYNSLLNVGCVPVAIQLKYEDFEKPVDQTKLLAMPVNVVRQTLIDLGVDKDSLESVHNDLLYCGRKFMGVETIFKNNQCSINFMVTLFYKPEESIFKRLTGKYALKRQITGIIEETNLFTREEFTEKLMKNLGDFLATV